MPDLAPCPARCGCQGSDGDSVGDSINYTMLMDNTPHWLIVLLWTVGELAFALVALPLYIFLVLPKYDAGALPGFSPLIADGVNPLIAVAVAAVIVAVSIGMAVLLLRVLGKEKVITREIAMLESDFSMIDLVPVFAAAGFAEEFLFRVVCVDLLGPIVAAILFTAAHFSYWKQPILLADVFVVGLLLGFFYVFTQSLLLCAIAHFVYNMAIVRLVGSV